MNKHEKIRKIAEELNIIDDALFQKMAEDKEFCEEMISTILRQKVPDVVSIFISKFDIFGDGKTVYHVERVVRETGKVRRNVFFVR